MFVFGNLILHLEVILLKFVKSIRKSDFKLYIQVLKEFTPRMYILDHYNYERWLLVHLNEMANLQKSYSAVYEEFLKGKLTVQKKQKKILKNCTRPQP